MLLIALASGLIFVHVWVPRLNAQSIGVLSREADRQLDVIGKSLTPFLLNNQFAGIHETLDSLMNSRDNWVEIRLENAEGRLIYPFFAPVEADHAQYWSTTKTITFQDRSLGEIALTVDFSTDLQRLTGVARNLGLLGLSLVIVLLMVIWLVMESLVIRRLKILSDAAREISVGNYAAVLPPTGKDEVGTLSESFSNMRESIRRNEAELTEATHKAQQATEAKSQFLATMSHEIRTPLNGVIPVVELLAATDLDADQRRLVDTIRISGEALGSIIDDILDFSRLDAGRMSMRSAPYVLIDLIEDVCDILGPSVQNRQLSIQSHVDPALSGGFLGDGERLRQVILNIAGNAAKFTETGGICVCASQTSDDAGADWIRVEISDTGIGIPEDELDNIFGRFAQVDSGATKKFGGSGLGLAISRMLIEAMGGEIGVRSQTGVGSTFWFTLPLIADPAQHGVIQRREAPGLLALLDDDSAPDGPLIARTLTEYGYDLRIFASIDALHAANIAPARLLLNAPPDHPGRLGEWQDGLDRGPFKTVPRVILSTSTERTEAPHTALLLKPIHCRDLLASLAAPLPEVAQITAPADPDAPERALHILVVDDNVINQEVTSAMLEALGHTSVVVGDGQTAIDTVAAMPFDLVLMDVQMPIMDGLEATRQIRSLDGPPRETTIYGLSASAMEEEARKCFDAGMDDFLSKPLNRKKLQATIQSVRDAAARNTAALPPRP
ncbi:MULTISPECIES: ATP-binding protein [unclassified Marinovum]